MLYENLDGTGRRFETNTSLLIQGGDISSERRDGSSRGESIYGESFADESFEQMHSEPGLLSMAGSDPPPRGGPDAPAPRRDANASQFFITTKSTTQAHAIPNPHPHPHPHPNPNPNQALRDARAERDVAREAEVRLRKG